MTFFRRAMLTVVLAPACAHATAFQDLEAINKAAALATEGNVRAVDPRLKLAACPEALVSDPPVFGTITVRCASLGWRVRVLTIGGMTAATTTPIVIRRGDPVSVSFVAPRFSVTTSGVADSDARTGERVRIRIDQKATPIMGEAIDAGQVRVGRLN